MSQFSYTVRNNDYSLVYTVEDDKLGLYKVTDLQEKNNLADDKPEVVKEMQETIKEFINSSKPPINDINKNKFGEIKKSLGL